MSRTQHFTLGTVALHDLSTMANNEAMSRSNYLAAEKFDSARSAIGAGADKGPNHRAMVSHVTDWAMHKSNMPVTRKSEFHTAANVKPEGQSMVRN